MLMKNKSEQNRQEIIRQILARYGSIDHIDVCCLARRFHVRSETILKDVQCAEQALKQQALAQQREAQAQEERQLELKVARAILRGESG
jgi:DeoR/GlpR family transcriptional regulator of sugar metabolism